MPTLPLEPGSAAAHSMVSYPSSASFKNGTNSPPDAYRPRQSCTTTM